MRRAWSRFRDRAVGRRRSGWTVRLRLTALYGGLFLLSGGTLLVVTYALAAHRIPSSAVFVNRSLAQPGSAIHLLVTRPAPPYPELPQGALPFGAQLKASAVPSPDKIIGQVRSVVDVTRSSSLHQLWVGSAVALGVMAVISSGLGWLMAGRALRPLRAMTGAAQRISAENLHERLPETGPRDELRDLAATFNALLGRLEAAFDSQRRFVANASHELRTPLTLERAVVEVTLADPTADVGSLRAMGQRVLEIGADQEALIAALITLARSQRGLDERHPVDLAAAAEEVVGGARERAQGRSVTIDADLQPASLSGDGRLVGRLVANLVDNAVGHNYPGGRVEVRTDSDDGRARLTVSNTGPVVAAGELARLLQPFQRGEAERTTHGGGLGLGLSIVDAIASAHGAQLAVTPRLVGGLDIEVSFPGAGD